MPKLRLDLDDETFQALADIAFTERRPVPFQAEVLLRQALGLQFPYPSAATNGEPLLSSPRVSRD
jgi:hypothetical protein